VKRAAEIARHQLPQIDLELNVDRLVEPIFRQKRGFELRRQPFRIHPLERRAGIAQREEGDDEHEHHRQQRPREADEKEAGQEAIRLRSETAQRRRLAGAARIAQFEAPSWISPARSGRT
jgi:hypothetical protein